MKQKLLILLLIYSCSPFSLVNAADTEELKTNIEQSLLVQWLSLEQREGSDTNIEISGIPQGYKSPECKKELTIRPTKALKLGRNSIQISCPYRSSWSLMLNADIEVWRNVVVLRDHLSRGGRIKSDSLVLQRRNTGDLQRGYFTDIAEITGNISKRSLKAGTAISPSMINLPIIVQRGQAVNIRVERPGFAVDVKGLALKKGRKGDTIKVKNSSSQKVLYGKIIHADLILVE